MSEVRSCWGTTTRNWVVVLAAACSGAGCSAVGAPTDEPEVQLQALTNVPPIAMDDAELDRMKSWVATNRVDPAKIKRNLWTKEGRRVHCVSALQQPGLRVEGATELETPPMLPPEAQETLLGRRALPEPLLASTTPGAPSAACEAGSVPIAEVTLEDLKRFRTLKGFLAKSPRSQSIGNDEDRATLSGLLPPVGGVPSDEHEHAVAKRDVTNWGALATMNVWRPLTQVSAEFSLSQMWVSAGSGSNLQTLEAGWHVYRDLYGDATPHLFIYSTRDGYGSTGCYNNTCGDFVQTSSSVFPGQALSPYSTPGAENQWQTAIRWVKNGDSGSWWLWVEGEYVGYYRRSLFNAVSGVANHATHIEFGGEVVNLRTGGSHTTTDMGSGKAPSGGFGVAAYQSSLRYFYTVDSAGTVRFREATGLVSSGTQALCYNLSYTSGVPGAGSTIYFGGTGYHSVNCP